MFAHPKTVNKQFWHVFFCFFTSNWPHVHWPYVWQIWSAALLSSWIFLILKSFFPP